MAIKLKRWLSKSNKGNDKSNETSRPEEYNKCLEPKLATRQIIDNFEFNETTEHYEVPGINKTAQLLNSNSRALSESPTPVPLKDPRELVKNDSDHQKLLEITKLSDSSNKVFGYENFGNTCYCNSVLQCLYNIPELRDNVIKYPMVPNEQKFNFKNTKTKVYDENSFDNNTRLLTVNNNNSHNQNGTLKNLYKNNTQSSSQELLSKIPLQRRNSFKILASRDQSMLYSTSNSTNASFVSSDQRADTEPTRGHVMASTPITEKIHEISVTTIVGRKKNIRQINILETGKYENNMAKPMGNDNDNDMELTDDAFENDETLENIKKIESSEGKKQTALISGPVLNIDTALNTNGKSNMYSALKDIFDAITENNHLTGIVSPKELIETLKRENMMFNSMMHQDAHEFLNFLLNQISDNIESNMNNPNNDNGEFGGLKFERNFINDLFQGVIKYTTRCLTCDNITSREELFLDFAIEVSNNEETNIQEILGDYSQREMLNGSNKFFCDCCSGLQEAERIVGLKKLPETLILHLKRFKYSEEQNSNIKLFNKINYPLVLQVSSTSNSDISKSYDLTGIVLHLGGGPQHGHYVSICKNEKYGWLLFDDEVVVSITEESVLKFVGDPTTLTTAYLLVYKLKDEKYEENVSDIDYENNIKILLENDDFVRKYVSQSSSLNEKATKQSVLEDVQEDDLYNEDRVDKTVPSSKSSKRRSKMFSFGL
ncbi:hypothetical protein TPHA_0E00870 [Tetrapisispora phaffii CBS 4417]|uniref:Ubiquitin carboxyl-terminal hydrolase n=1 Tax=Tetrapisispora phaffii (strain ATCC 24235 / CBS 4417 / NBRC 1672 / NRRL Y-8282 / UCD 70-5) TaxID=1071381 RepID=G8BTF4_TETPH|nr:hypothetical protein TPHA_0E00870 [Tetrapisispora phaffii CBS 4417]CCE63182.1 hypothetical protein TPHA_0E00870 [Tetrapisispora phaffii CBS 4417]